MNRRWVGITALFIIALLIAGCGGGSDDSTQSTVKASTQSTAEAEKATKTATKGPLVKKATLIKEGDEICAEANAAIFKLESSSQASSQKTISEFYAGMVSLLEVLGEPQESDGYPELSAASKELSTAENQVKATFSKSDDEREAAESDASAALSSFRDVASEYGFEACGEEPNAAAAENAPPSGTAEALAAEAEASRDVGPETNGSKGKSSGGAGSG